MTPIVQKIDGRDVYYGHVAACEKCLAHHESELAALRRRFDMLIDSGVSRVRTNEILSGYIHRTYPKRSGG